MARSDPAFMLRLPADLKLRIENSAREAGRTITAEMVHRLSNSFDPAALTEEGDALDRALIVAAMRASPRARAALRVMLDHLDGKDPPVR